MAGEPRQPGRSRPVSGTPSDSPEPTTPESDDPTAPITANTPLPPLSLASQPGAGSAAPPPAQEAWFVPTDQPTIPPTPGSQAPQQSARGVAGAGISSTWAAYTMFALVFTSLILIVIMAIAAAEISHKPDVLIWIIVITFVINMVYAVVVYNIARPGPGQPFRIPFIQTRRGP